MFLLASCWWKDLVSVDQEDLLANWTKVAEVSLWKQDDEIELESLLKNLDPLLWQSNDFNICMQDSFSRCGGEVYTRNAIDNNDILLCDKILDASLKWECKRSLSVVMALETWNIDMCQDIWEANEKKVCENSVFSELAINQDDISLCDNISTDFGKNTCMSNYYYDKALKTKDSTYCDKIDSKSTLELKEFCFLEVQK